MGERKTKALSLYSVVEETVRSSSLGVCEPDHEKELTLSQYNFIMQVMSAVLEKVQQGETVRVPCFGQFSLRKLDENTRNPKTNLIEPTKDRNRLRFKASDKTIPILNQVKKDAP